MPIHDWTRVLAGTFHDFHQTWIIELRRALNRGLLPPGYYALADQVARPAAPDVLTLQESAANDASAPDPTAGGADDGGADDGGADDGGGTAVAIVPPHATLTDTVDEATLYAARRDRVVVRHATGDRVVAVIELVSPGNKQKRAAVDQFVDKSVDLLTDGRHLLLVDLFPPRRFDPDGMHGAVWAQLGGSYDPPAGKPLTAAAYAAIQPVTCYVDPLAVGDRLPDLPLFLTPRRYVNVPLERTYMAAYEDVQPRWRAVIERPG